MINDAGFTIGTGVVASTTSKDVLRVQLKINDYSGVIDDVEYKVFGSTGLRRDLESLPNRLIGMSIYTLDELDLSDISKDTNKSNLVISAINAAVDCYMDEAKYR